MLDVASGHVDLAFTGMSQIKPFLENQHVKLLGTSGHRRLKSAPDIKTIAEQGFDGFDAFVWWGILAPAGTPPDIINTINNDLRKALSDKEVIKRLEVIDGEVKVSSPEAFNDYLRQEIKRWSHLSKSTPAKDSSS